jgi:hypothetical protein
MKLKTFLLVTFLFLVVFTSAENVYAQESALAATDSIVSTDSIYSAFTGKWEGKLEYRDYKSNKRVALPTELEVALSSDGNSLLFSYSYNDGPNKIVKSTETITIDEKTNKLTFKYDSNKTDEFVVTGLEEFSKSKSGKLILSGKGNDNDRDVDVRKTITLKDKTLTILKEVRLPNQEFIFRNSYTFQLLEKNN